MSNLSFVGNPEEWAASTFGRSRLGDARLVRRAVDYAARQARSPASSTAAACKGDSAAAEGAYRLIRNERVEPKALEEGPFEATAEQCEGRKKVLVIQDSTGLSPSGRLAEQLGDLGSSRGFFVHSALAVDGDSKVPLGLLDQQRWIRDDERLGAAQRKTRPYEEKESYKWQRCSEAIRGRVSSMDNIVEVSDREADLYEYLSYKTSQGERFIVRAAQPRRVDAEEGALWEFMEAQPVLGTYEVFIEQRGGQKGGSGTKSSGIQKKRKARKRRTVTMELRSATTVTVLAPRRRGAKRANITVNVVYAREVVDGASEKEPRNEREPLDWMLLTTEPAATFEEALVVVGDYECRWLIEEFHKVWKQGCAVENRPMQAPANYEKVSIFTAHAAVRMLQLRALDESHPDTPCDQVFTQDEWHCLWAMSQRGKRRPKKAPTVRWALIELGKLGGWLDTKRTGRIGWKTLWSGWAQFEWAMLGWSARD